MKEMRNEKARYDNSPAGRVMLGTTMSVELYPPNENDPILNSVSTKSTRKSVIAELAHLKSPKVKRLSGRSSKLITGLIRSEARVNATAVTMRLIKPFSK
ncbi:MAG TPA: hypothetical protein VLE44_03030 [Candidatus Saccharimonadales bacterium]|nr:hypothetical protein [Candidatus Saccharimonadales bacterium]